MQKCACICLSLFNCFPYLSTVLDLVTPGAEAFGLTIVAY